MPKYSVGQIVKLRSGRIGKITRIITDSDMAHTAAYQVSFSDIERCGVTGLDVMATTTEHHWNRQKRGLTSYESDTLDRYTGPTFRAWNAHLRSGQAPTPEIIALQSVLEKSPKYQGYVYRGLSFDSREKLDAFVSGFTKGQTYVTPQFMSTSISNAAAMHFKGDVWGAFMRIYTGGTDGARLREFTGTADLGENEVLFRYGCNFDVVDVSGKGGQSNIQLTVHGARRPAEKLEIPEFKQKTKT